MTTSLFRLAFVMTVVVATTACSGSSGASAPAGPSESAGSSAASATPGPSVLASAPSPTPTLAPAVLPGEPWIAYQGGTEGSPRIRLVRPDGTDDHELTPGAVAGAQYHPDWSHDGNRLAFAVDASDGTRDIWIANADGTDAHLVQDCAAPCKWMDAPAWSPDDTKLGVEHGFLVDAGTGAGDSTVEVIELSSGSSRTVFDAAPTEYVSVPRWSPDGNSIVFELDRYDSARLDAETVVASTIIIADATGSSQPERVLSWDSWATGPDWDPTQDRFTYVAPTSPKDPFGPADIHVVGLDGRGSTRITDFGATGGWAIQPAWTPDGARIVFVGEDVVRTEPNIATIEPDGSGVERMAWDGTSRTHPRLRPVP